MPVPHPGRNVSTTSPDRSPGRSMNKSDGQFGDSYSSSRSLSVKVEQEIYPSTGINPFTFESQLPATYKVAEMPKLKKYTSKSELQERVVRDLKDDDSFRKIRKAAKARLNQLLAPVEVKADVSSPKRHFTLDGIENANFSQTSHPSPFFQNQGGASSRVTPARFRENDPISAGASPVLMVSPTKFVPLHDKEKMGDDLEKLAKRDFTVDLNQDEADDVLESFERALIDRLFQKVSPQNDEAMTALKAHNETLCTRMMSMEQHLLERSRSLSQCRYSYFLEIQHLRNQVLLNRI